MVEYGNGISHGGAGQVSGGGGGGGPVDVGASVGHWVTSTVATVSALPPLEILAIAVAIVVGLILLRRAF
jgi:hypothetical protein